MYTHLAMPDACWQKDTNCGNHNAASCEYCPQGNGAPWCNGDCKWSNNQCVEKDSTGNECFICILISASIYKLLH